MYPFFSEWTTFQCDRIFLKFLPSIRTAIRKFFAKDLSLFKLDSIFTFRYLLWSLYQLDWNAFYLRGHLQFPSSYRLSHLTRSHTHTHTLTLSLAHTHTYAHTRTHTHLRSHTHKHTFTHARTLFLSPHLQTQSVNLSLFASPWSLLPQFFCWIASFECPKFSLFVCLCNCVMASLSLSGDVCACVFVDL